MTLTHDQSIERYRRVRETADADEIVDLFTPDASYRSSVFREPWEGDNAVGRDARTEHFRDTEGQAPIRSRTSRSAGCRVLPSAPGWQFAEGQAAPAVSHEESQTGTGCRTRQAWTKAAVDHQR
jgi:hypothetical protein